MRMDCCQLLPCSRQSNSGPWHERWIQSTCGLYLESHESFMIHMVPFHLWYLSCVTCIRHESDGSIPPVIFINSYMGPLHLSYLSGVTWICLESHGCNPPVFFIESHGSVLSQLDPVHHWSIFFSPDYEPLSSVNSSFTISCSRTPLHGVVFRRCEADFVVNLVMQ